MKLLTFQGAVLAVSTLALAGVPGPARAQDERRDQQDRDREQRRSRDDQQQANQADREEARLSAERQQQLIQLQQVRTQQYSGQLEQQQRLAEQRATS